MEEQDAAIEQIAASASPASPDGDPPEDVDDISDSSIGTGRKLEHIPEGPCTHSWWHYSPIPQQCKDVPVCVGVDEAGRGPVLGPMVYAVSYVPVSLKDKLAEIGFADSKILKEEQRDELFDRIQENEEWLGWGAHTCSPQDISEGMLRGAKYNLNELAHDTTIGMIRHLLSVDVQIAEVFIDTVGPPATYQAKLSNLFPRIKFTVAKKADSLYPCVSAASIVAKVTRDSILRHWEFVEPSLNESVSKAFGSGYPSDPNTVNWLKDNFDPVFGYPRVIRFSWSTCTKILEAKGVKVRWPEEEEEGGPDLRTYFGSKENGDEGKAAPARDSIFGSVKEVTVIRNLV
ncbi:ribonuclease H-like domain-containing protein [Gaertneriomyces semiglobifer]|nr:ribonuclease H-like domain-containing protein [Gaertneriomyces semiglobifer]